MNIKPIRTEQDYEAALRAVEPMFDNEPEMNTPEGDFFEVMSPRRNITQFSHHHLLNLLTIHNKSNQDKL